MVTMHRAIEVIKTLHGALSAWVEIADYEDQRDSDDEILEKARRFLRDAGHPLPDEVSNTGTPPPDISA